MNHCQRIKELGTQSRIYKIKLKDDLWFLKSAATAKALRGLTHTSPEVQQLVNSTQTTAAVISLLQLLHLCDSVAFTKRTE